MHINVSCTRNREHGNQEKREYQETGKEQKWLHIHIYKKNRDETS